MRASSVDPPVTWGVLGAANIAVSKVVPAIQASRNARVVAIASRDRHKADAAARALAIERAYGSYEELLADPTVDVVYNPLPNHLHVPWTARAIDAGKHVLCEKPLALSAAEARSLVALRDRAGVLVGEAFMVRSHPQWLRVRDLVREGRIGTPRLVQGHFSYFKNDPADVRSRVDYGGGALYDIGCYPITLARWLYNEEPMGALALIERDPALGVDRLTSALLRFPSGQAAFTCATQLVPFQQMQIFGTTGRVAVEIPFNAPPDRGCRILVDDGSRLASAGGRWIDVDPVNQYTLQADEFSRAVRGHGPVPVPLEDAIANLAVIDALFRSADTGRWESPGDFQAVRD